MHPDGIDPGRTDGGRQSDPAAFHRCDGTGADAPGARVVGLGAPVSVRIRLTPCEVPLLQRQILRQAEAASLALLDTDAAARPEVRAHAAAAEREWKRMLESLDRDASSTPEVLWPTAHADPTLRGALAEALDAVAETHRGDDHLAQLAEALRTATTLLETLRAFLAVDHGGLQDVAL